MSNEVGKLGTPPDGYNTVTPYLVVHGASRLISFLKEVFSATEKTMFRGPEDSIMHSEIQLGDSVLMISDAQYPNPANPSVLHVYLSDVDSIYQKAIDAGAASVRQPEDQPFGDRICGIKDMTGNTWYIATKKEKLSQEEVSKRMSGQ